MNHATWTSCRAGQAPIDFFMWGEEHGIVYGLQHVLLDKIDLMINNKVVILKQYDMIWWYDWSLITYYDLIWSETTMIMVMAQFHMFWFDFDISYHIIVS